jgi:hypothetical protein
VVGIPVQLYRLRVLHNTIILQRQIVREAAAEFLGVMILIIFGNGVVCQVVLSGNPAVASSSKGVCSNCFAYLGIREVDPSARTTFPSILAGR